MNLPTTPTPLAKICTGNSSFDWECCSSSRPCNVGGGDCNSDDDCAGESTCGNDNCKSYFGYDWPSSSDCCTGKQFNSVRYETNAS